MPLVRRHSTAFVIAALALLAMMAGSGAPSPIYPIYQQLWGFSAATLTLVFAVYVAGLLVALLTVGSVSDHVGRRPVAVLSMLLLAVSMAVFIDAHGTPALFAARLLQGVATGACMGTLSALLVDRQPSARVGSLATSATPLAGIAAGSVLAGALVQWAPAPRLLIFWLLLGAYLLLAAALALVPEPAGMTRSSASAAWRSVLPSAGVPRQVRPAFLAVLPLILATWALGGLYLSLGSSVVATVFGIQDHFLAGVLVAANFAAGALGAVTIGSLPQSRRTAVGYLSLGLGVAVTALGVLTGVLGLYALGALVAGYGFGGSFRLVMGDLAARAPAAGRGQLFSSIFIVSYLAFSVPAVGAGFASQSLGLRPTVVTYAAVVLVLVALAAVLARRSSRSVPPAGSASPAAPDIELAGATGTCGPS